MSPIVNAKQIRIPKLYHLQKTTSINKNHIKIVGLSAISLQDSLSNTYRIPHQYHVFINLLTTNVDLAIDL